jgi:hypothetical protein
MVATLFVLGLLAGCERTVEVKVKVRSADSGLASHTSTAASAR